MLVEREAYSEETLEAQISEKVELVERKLSNVEEIAREEVEAIYRLLGRSKVFMCLNCGNTTILSSKKTIKTCPDCGSSNIAVFGLRDKEKLVEARVKFYRKLYEGSLTFLKIISELAPQLIGYGYIKSLTPFRIEVGSYSYITITHDKIRAYMHWLTHEADLELIKKLITTCKRYRDKLVKLGVIKLEIEVDSRLDHCRIPEKRLREMGFRKGEELGVKEYPTAANWVLRVSFK